MSHTNADHQRARRIRDAISGKRKQKKPVTAADRRWLEKYQETVDASRKRARTPLRSVPAAAPDPVAAHEYDHKVAMAPKPGERPRSLAELAAEPAKVGGDLAGGVCPHCKAAVDDSAEFCGACGGAARLDRCGKCQTPLNGAKFCPSCGRAADVPRAPKPDLVEPDPADEPEPPELLRGDVIDAPPPPPPTVETWAPEDVEWFVEAVDMGLVTAGMDMLTEKEKARITKYAAPMANKYLQAGGKWALEINFGFSLGRALLPRAWVKYVIAKEREDERREQLATKTTEEKKA